ncbi:tRNA (adenosine(37)-N6)-threonylcarbamoyltransferase complex ATPase subunit type 1 TsaE [Lacinutrix sp.]|uniref:tRNA (adenosine(37)-N6)-threonylcarbamoyltransferase complex ATPase subunit type 1 TsaE n=1 Tax=Lacinutrix sp. TaxID=1937692 RepID=UPI0025B8E1D7|nr:tRNA (adenosine(37)-N6)-threonylcarbamoyltransferase complex ATPase subunit type 1 TsaE [Lacinutrix sp.]
MQINYTLNEIDSVAKQILKHATCKTFIFKAEMGTGKTTLIKAIVKAIGCNDAVSSPTFSIVNEYKSKTETIYHFDLYRLEDESELYDFGIEDYLNNNAYVFIEWPELAQNLIEDYNCITINLKNDTTRSLNMSKS